LSLGPTAAYSGAENKAYTFTVRGEGTQTIGDGTVYIDWDDGTNSGTIAVTQADAEVILAGDGADGLSLSFTSGTLTGGDTFQVSTFAPLIQEASDAKIAFGSTEGGGSPITITSGDNTFDDVITGISLTVNKVTEVGETVSVDASRDIEGIKEEIYSFIERYNEVQSFIEKQNTYDSDTQVSGVLFGDTTLLSIQASIRNVVSSVVSGISSQYNQLVGVGIRTGADGQLSVKDASALDDALEDNLDEVIQLFTTSDDSSSNFIDFISASEDVVSGESFDVDITQAATHGGFKGGLIDDPASSPVTLDSSNNRIRLTVDGMVSDDIVLSEGTYYSYDDLISEIQTKIDADDKIGDKSVSVSWVDNGDGQGYINFESNNWGESSYVKTVGTIDDNAYLELGLYEGASYKGLNVEGTINGEEAEGKGRILTGKDGNATTDGLILKISITESQLQDGSEGSISITKGVASKMYDLIENYTDSSMGIINTKVNSLEKQIEINEGRIEDIDERLELKRDRLLGEYADMEVALNKYSSTSDYLQQQIDYLNSNWKWNQ